MKNLCEHAVWDWPLRLFHWILTILVLNQFATAKISGNAMDLHIIGGYTIFVILLFRIGWGFTGSQNSLFTNSIQPLTEVKRYLYDTIISKQRKVYYGHNPAGGWASIAMLVALALQTITGLISDDQIMFSGPIAYRFSENIVSAVTTFHSANAWLIIVMIFFHIFAIFSYLILHKNNLINRMINGGKMPFRANLKHRRNLSVRAIVVFSVSLTILLMMLYLA